LRFAALAYLAITPYTLMSLLETNRQLLALDNAIMTGTGGALTLPDAEGSRGVQLMREWSFWAGWRNAFLAVGWVGIVMGLGKELRVI
jgi:hypothetical protein